MRLSMRQYLLAVARHWWWLVAGVALGALSLADLVVEDIYIPTWALVVSAVTSLSAAQFLAFHDVRVERDVLVAKRARVVSPEKVFELSDLIHEVQVLANSYLHFETVDADDFRLRLDELRAKAYLWIDREAPEFSAAVRSSKGLADLGTFDSQDSFEVTRLITRLMKIRDQLMPVWREREALTPQER